MVLEKLLSFNSSFCLTELEKVVFCVHANACYNVTNVLYCVSCYTVNRRPVEEQTCTSVMSKLVPLGHRTKLFNSE